MNLQLFRNRELLCEDGCRRSFKELNYGCFPDKRGGNRMSKEKIMPNGEICKSDYENRILTQTDLYEIFPFGKTKVWALIVSGSLPLIKIGKDYITSWNVLEDWIRGNIGKEIYL